MNLIKVMPHARSSQALNIEEDLLDDDIGPSQARSAPPQSLPSTILRFGTSTNTSNMNTRGNTTIELPHTHATNLLGVSGKVVGNKRHKLSGDMEFSFKKLTKSSKKIETLKLELQREAIETTKSIAQSMITMEERSRKESKKQTLQLTQIFAVKLGARCPLDVQEN
jgi:hypothetical protein